MKCVMSKWRNMNIISYCQAANDTVCACEQNNARGLQKRSHVVSLKTIISKEISYRIASIVFRPRNLLVYLLRWRNEALSLVFKDSDKPSWSEKWVFFCTISNKNCSNINYVIKVSENKSWIELWYFYVSLFILTNY